MSSIWLVSCPPEKTARVRHEIEGIEPAAQLVRMGTGAEVAHVAEQMHGGAVAAALYECGTGAAAEPVVDHLAHACGVPTVLVLVEQLDAGCIARLFLAGATEVIAAGGPAASRDGDAACTGEGPEDVLRSEPPVDDKRFMPGVGASADAREALTGSDAPDAPVRPRPPKIASVATPSVPSESASAPCDAPMPSQATPAPQPAEVPAAPHDSEPPAAKAPAHASARVEEKGDQPSAPLVVAISGRGGCGKTTIVASMAWCAARMGLRAAVLDLDLMFGDLYRLMGVEQACDLGKLVRDEDSTEIPLEAIEQTAMRIAPGLTVWGPCALPEHAELLGSPVETLVSVLRQEADVIFADTSVFWGDAVASTVSHCDRCLIVGSAGASSDASASRAVALAARIGVPKTRMTSLFARLGAQGCNEERAMRFEMSVGLRSHVRIADGGTSVSELLAYGKLADVMRGSGAFVRDIQAFTQELMRELGCPLGAWDERQRMAGAHDQGRSRIKLPWNR